MSVSKHCKVDGTLPLVNSNAANVLAAAGTLLEFDVGQSQRANVSRKRVPSYD